MLGQLSYLGNSRPNLNLPRRHLPPRSSSRRPSPRPRPPATSARTAPRGCPRRSEASPVRRAATNQRTKKRKNEQEEKNRIKSSQAEHSKHTLCRPGRNKKIKETEASKITRDNSLLARPPARLPKGPSKARRPAFPTATANTTTTYFHPKIPPRLNYLHTSQQHAAHPPPVTHTLI